MVSNNSPTDAGISVFVDGEWVYTGLSYPPLYKAISFSGRLIDPNTIQEMRFMELDTTCRPLSSEDRDMRSESRQCERGGLCKT